MEKEQCGKSSMSGWGVRTSYPFWRSSAFLGAISLRLLTRSRFDVTDSMERACVGNLAHWCSLHSSHLHFSFLACLFVFNRRFFSITVVSSSIFTYIYMYDTFSKYDMTEYSVWQSIVQSILAWSKVIVFLTPCFDNLARERTRLNLRIGGSPLRHEFFCLRTF